jgi:sugar phosphate isomerase/epimerase
MEADEVHSRLSVNTIGFGERPLREFVAELAAHDLDVLGVPMVQLSAGGLAENITAVRDSDCTIVTTVVPQAFTLPDPARWEDERTRLRAGLDVAAELDCAVLYTTTGSSHGMTWDEAAARFTDAIAPVAEHARTVGVRLAIENTTTMRADLGFVHVLTDAADLVQQSGIALCADLFAAWTDRALEKTIVEHADAFALVQIADFVLGTLQTPDRAVPGDGDIPIARQLLALAAGGYTGRIELELLGPRIVAEGVATAAARGVRVLTEMLAQADGTS